MAEFKHITVLLNEAVDGLNIKPDGTYVDCTLGGGGHSGLILSKLSENGKLYSFDQDITAINFNKDKFEEENELGKINFIKSNFRNISEELNKRNKYSEYSLEESSINYSTSQIFNLITCYGAEGTTERLVVNGIVEEEKIR